MSRLERCRRLGLNIVVVLILAGTFGCIGDRHPTVMAPVPPAAAAGTWVLHFSDDFERDSLGADWLTLEGRWVLEDGRLVGGTPGDGFSNMILVAGEFSGGQRLEFDASTDLEAPSDLSCMLGCDEMGLHDGYFLGFGSNDNECSKLLVQGEEVFRTDAGTIAPGRLHHVVAEAFGNVVRLTVDGDLVFERTVEIPLKGEFHRKLGLYTWNGGAFDNVRVYTKAEE